MWRKEKWSFLGVELPNYMKFANMTSWPGICQIQPNLVSCYFSLCFLFFLLLAPRINRMRQLRSSRAQGQQIGITKPKIPATGITTKGARRSEDVWLKHVKTFVKLSPIYCKNKPSWANFSNVLIGFCEDVGRAFCLPVFCGSQVEIFFQSNKPISFCAKMLGRWMLE